MVVFNIIERCLEISFCTHISPNIEDRVISSSELSDDEEVIVLVGDLLPLPAALEGPAHLVADHLVVPVVVRFNFCEHRCVAYIGWFIQSVSLLTGTLGQG